jgi:hypothetical protein
MEDRMKKIIILSVLLALSLFMFNCGGGSGSSSSPKGENPGEPSIVQLLPAQFVAQTNSIITLHAKVLDGNGAPVKNIPVSFTNLSPIGTLNSTTAQTNNAGIATVTLKSTTSGFSTVQAEINKGVSQVRDRKTVFFSSLSTAQSIPRLELNVDGAGKDSILFETAVPNDDEVIAIATVTNAIGQPLIGMDVLFGSDSEEAIFPLGSLAMTDTNGQASVLVRVIPSTMRALPTVINITAIADNGAFDIVSLTLSPVEIKKENISVSASPKTIESPGTSTITVEVTTTAGTPAPNGTAVKFKITSGPGTVDPHYAQTTNGFVEAKYTAPEVKENDTATIKAYVGNEIDGVYDDDTVTIEAPEIEPPTPPTLTVTPTTASVSCTAGGVRTFVVVGGVSPYKVTSSNPNVTLVGASGTPPTVTINASGGSFTASLAAGSCGSFPDATSTVPLVVTDNASAVTSATLTVTNP